VGSLVIPFATLKRWGLAGGLSLLLLLGFAVSRLFSVSCGDTAECVTLSELRRGEPPPEAMHLYDRDGTPMADVAGPLRRSLSREQIPDLLREAFVAVEDRRFWDHRGVDALGIARAAVRNVSSGGIEEGASTIPMQLVRTLWAEPLRDVGRWRRKIIEARTAPRLIEELGHERVLDLYLNSIYLGNGVYGVGLAADYYFGTTADSLTLPQVALLVGMTRAPERYDPRRHPERARAVRDVVLGALQESGVVTPEAAETARAAGLDLFDGAPPLESRRQRTYVTAAVTRELRRVAPELAGRDGLHVYTTIDPRVQEAGEAALAAQLAAIEEGRYGRFDSEDAGGLQGASVALDPRTGAVLAWIGGRDFTASEFDRVEQGQRQVGSLVKPFLVATALERGYGITAMVSSDTVPIDTDRGPWLPADHVTETELPLREALVRSSNRAAAHLGETLGLDAVARLAERGGIDRIPELPSSAIGAFDAALVDVTAAYASFGNGGSPVEPHLISRVIGHDGTVLWERPEEVLGAEPVMSEETAFVVLDAMRAVVDRGTGYSVRARGYWGPAAGKTGTTNEGRDAWFVGLTPGLVAGIWIGFDAPREIVRGRGGGDLAAPPWGTWMNELQRTPRFVRSAWIPPAGVERVRYDERTGEVVDFSCDARRAGLQEAWVHTGRYASRDCRRPGLLQRMWRGIMSFEPRSARRRR
jgi:penicillin-binding protein 1A